MTELIANVQQLTDLEQQQLELLPERKRLEKEVFDLKIAAHNAQVDVEAMESFSVNGLWLKITGKYEEKLEEAQRQARSAQSQYNLAAAKLANVEAQLRHIAQALPELIGCEMQLSEMLAVKLGALPCSEEARQVKALEEAFRIGGHVQETGIMLENAINAVLSAYNTSTESAAQALLREYREMVAQLRQQLADLGHTMEPNQFSEDSLLEFFTGFFLDTRFDKTQQQIIQIRWRWKALLPALEHQYRQARVQWLQALIAAV